jgi:hypothetical protein
MEWLAFTAEHLRTLTLQPAQRDFAERLCDDGYARMLTEAGCAVTACYDGRVFACGGAIELWPGRAQVWSLISADAGPHFVAIVRGMRRFLALQDAHRIEAVVDTNFAAGHRLARMLGFVREGTMRAYDQGRDCDLYARVS